MHPRRQNDACQQAASFPTPTPTPTWTTEASPTTTCCAPNCWPAWRSFAVRLTHQSGKRRFGDPGAPCKNPKFACWELHEKPGLIRVTVVTFMLYEARVVQASCDASSSSPSLMLSLRASYPRQDNCDSSEEVARKILPWAAGPGSAGP